LRVQALTAFVVIPLGAMLPLGHVLLALCQILFAAICVTVSTRVRFNQFALLAALAV